MSMHGGPTAEMVKTRPLRDEEVPLLEPLLRQHVRDSETGEVIEAEVAAILQYMRGAPDSSNRTRKYLIACDGLDRPIGCAAVAEPDPQMLEHFGARQERTRELLNLFSDGSRNGLGRALFEAACGLARIEGSNLLVVNSGPRYVTSWPFYDAVCDTSAGFIRNYYGTGYDAKTWRKAL